MEERLVDPLLSFLDEAFPDGIAILGRTEAKESERSVGEAVFGRGLREHLRGNAARREVDEIVVVECGLAGRAIIFAEGVGDVAGFVGARELAGSGKDSAVRLDGVDVVAQHRTGHVETLLGETMHAVDLRRDEDGGREVKNYPVKEPGGKSEFRGISGSGV